MQNSTFIFSYSQREVQDNNLSIEKHIENRGIEADSLINVYEYKKALKIIHECIKKSESIQNYNLLLRSYITSGIIKGLLGNTTEAIEDYKKTVNLSKKTKNYRLLGLAYNNIGVDYFIDDTNLDSTIVYYKKALEVFEKTKDTFEIPLAAANLGEVYKKKNEYKKALNYLDKSIYYTKLIPKVYDEREATLSFTYMNYAEIYLKNNNLKESLKYINLSQKVAEKENLEQDLVVIYKLKSTILEKLGDLKKAYFFLSKHDDYLVISNKIEKSTLTQEAAVKFEIKQNKILLEKTTLEKRRREHKIKKSRQIIIFTAILFLVTIIGSYLLYKNNKLKLKTNQLLLLKNEELKKLQQQTELNFLKTQVQPHFFFNTLSILKKLILKKSKKAEEVVLKLSDLMQYSIYDAKKEKVIIWDEISSIQNYLEIERLYKNQDLPAVQINGNLDYIKIPPLLFFSFVENCFEYNNVRKNYRDLYLFFKNIDNKYLLFSINCYDVPVEVKKTTTVDINTKNIERRLNLIYKNDYSIAIENNEDIFRASIKIPIDIL